MKQKTIFLILSGILAFVLLIMLFITLALEPWAEKKIQSKFNDSVPDYLLEIGKVNISVIKSNIALQNITLSSKQEKEGIPLLKGEIEIFNLQGVKLLKALFRQDIEISEVCISGSRITGEFSSQEKAAKAKISPLNIRIDRLILDDFYLDIKSDSTAQAFLISDGYLNFRSLEVGKSDTLSPALVKPFDFEAQEFKTVTADSLYTVTIVGINYSATSGDLLVSHFALQPNYTEYEFTARHRYESDRFQAECSQVSFRDFSTEDFIKTGNLTGTYIEIGEFTMKAFRDKREEFHHVNRPTFQELIYNYPGTIDIDSLSILSGSITYTEHDEEANEAGMIWFDELKASIYTISNDTVYKTKEAYIEINAEALLMGKGKTKVNLKGRLFDSENTFTAYGTLSGMEVNEMNPILEKNAFVYATTGKVESMDFSFTANNTRATGKMQMIYNGLEITFKNRNTDDTTALKERIISWIANMKVMESNPMPGEEVRTGIIYFERDPEKFLFNYFVKSILSGIKSSFERNTKEKKK
jgi:hypothetical protein